MPDLPAKRSLGVDWIRHPEAAWIPDRVSTFAKATADKSLVGDDKSRNFVSLYLCVKIFSFWA
jgi:hypothetical protein